MSLQIIGPGFGRTETRSLKMALEVLGFDPCHHMQTLFAEPAQRAFWKSLAAGGTVDWHEVFAGYRSQMDWPGAHVWRDLSRRSRTRLSCSAPDPPKPGGPPTRDRGQAPTPLPTLPLPTNVTETLEAMDQLRLRRDIDLLRDRETAIAAFHRQLAEVRAAVPAERLLVFAIGDGWAPLCDFLQVPVPESPFPRLNDGDDFWTRFGGEPVEA